MEREIEAAQKAVEGEKKKCEELVRERDILNKLKTSAETATHRQMDLIKINDNTKRNLEQEVQGYKIEAQRQAKVNKGSHLLRHLCAIICFSMIWVALFWLCQLRLGGQEYLKAVK